MTDMITVSRKEVEALQRWQDDEEIANNCYEDDDGCFILYDDLRALLDKAEVVSGEPVAQVATALAMAMAMARALALALAMAMALALAN